jgi:hypothetical protein
MSDTSDQRGGGTVRSLKEAIRRVRTAEAERSDVVVELRDAERARLEMLADELRSVFAEVPEEHDAFSLSIAGGTPPRLWIDMTSFVVMDRDRRTYRFLKDTRLGRTVIIESPDLGDVADMITSYVAERIIERERAMEGDWLLRRTETTDARGRRREPRPLGRVLIERPAAESASERRVTGWVVAAFLGGLLIGVVALFAYVVLRLPA